VAQKVILANLSRGFIFSENQAEEGGIKFCFLIHLSF
jgi:hypothetical protein